MEKALKYLEEKGCTCVATNGTNLYFSHLRGVAPLLAWYDEKVNISGYSVADKVVGKGASFLYALLGVKEVYAKIISRSALQVLRRYGIEVEYFELADYIINRKGDGRCPIETALDTTCDKEGALEKIRLTLVKLKE